MSYTGFCLSDYDEEKCKDCSELIECLNLGVKDLLNSIYTAPIEVSEVLIKNETR